MLKPDFKKYSLALFHENKLVYSSNQSGIKPLINCVDELMGTYANCVLFDKIVGLASARIIAYSQMISSVETKVASARAAKFLSDAGIELIASELVGDISNRDGSSVCPFETLAKETPDDGIFIEKVRSMITP